ncbi:DELLA protein RGL1-like [Senna tora]|uniref:DELLA protein RGL1-like n=1 Tax=Senna tora TaxID=362788 RepID=A0A834SLP9_9FABA|nr:DELLA protein RGL1-like [Senna tora]
MNNINASPREIFYLLTLTLLSLILPLSFLLLARLSGAQYYVESLTRYNSPPHYPFPYLISLALRINPPILYLLVSCVSVAALIHGLTGKITLFADYSYSQNQPRLYTAWIVLCTFQVCVGLGIEGSIAAGLYDEWDSSFGVERSLLSRVIFLMGLHETTQLWCRAVVKPVVDDTVFGVGRSERWIERVAMAGSLGGLWWWKLREEVETLVVMAEAKKEQFMDVGMADFVGWWLYYLTVTIGMVRLVKALMWLPTFSLCRRSPSEINSPLQLHPCQNDDKVNTVSSIIYTFIHLYSTMIDDNTHNPVGAHENKHIVPRVHCQNLSYFLLQSDMASDLLSSTPFNFNGIQGGYDPIQEDVVSQGKHNFSSDMEFLEDMTPNRFIKDQNQLEPKFDNLMFQDFTFEPVLQPTQAFPETTRLKNHMVATSEFVRNNNNNKPSQPSSILASLELLNNYGSRLKRLTGQNISKPKPMPISSESRHKLSTEEIIRVAGERYVQFSTHWHDNICIPMHPYGFGLGLGGLSEEENRDVELVQFLLTAAERVGCEQFERAGRLVLHCQLNSSARTSPVQKVISYFAQALGERIAKETGITTALNGSEKNEEQELVQKMDFNSLFMCHNNLPFHQVMQLTSIQAIVEHVASETKIHVIDLEIKSGVQWTALMQALAERHERPVQLLKITGIGYRGKTKLETGQYLAKFAESLNLPFSYNAVFVTDMMEIRESHFHISDDEALVVSSPYVLRKMVSRPECLENLMRIIKNMKPSIMLVLEVEANHNSPSFVNRFVEALFFYSAFLDCIETCMKEENACKVTLEAILGESIRNIVAMEGKDRRVRSVKIDVWRRFFARYRAVETGFSESSLYQANLVIKEFPHGKFCTLDNNGKTLTVGWKGTQIHSLSAWKFL